MYERVLLRLAAPFFLPCFVLMAPFVAMFAVREGGGGMCHIVSIPQRERVLECGVDSVDKRLCGFCAHGSCKTHKFSTDRGCVPCCKTIVDI